MKNKTKYIALFLGLSTFSVITKAQSASTSFNPEDISYHRATLSKKIEEVRQNCNGIKSSIDTIFGLSIATTASSSLGTLSAGGALATGLAKAHYDYKLDEKTLENEPDKFIEDFDKLCDDMLASMKKTSDTLGNLRTGLIAGATATSTVSTGTSIAASVSAKDLSEKMERCNKSVSSLKSSLSAAKSDFELDYPISERSVKEPLPSDLNALISSSTSIIENCTGFDTDNINTLKNNMAVSAITSGLGSATGIAGTVTSAIANSKMKTTNRTKSKKLDVASNILAGITAGSSATSTGFSGTSIAKVKKDSDMAQACESVLY